MNSNPFFGVNDTLLKMDRIHASSDVTPDLNHVISSYTQRHGGFRYGIMTLEMQTCHVIMDPAIV